MSAGFSATSTRSTFPENARRDYFLFFFTYFKRLMEVPGK